MAPGLWQGELGGTFLIGDGTDYQFTPQFKGLGLPEVESDDTPMGDYDGQAAGPDRYLSQFLMMPVDIRKASPTLANQSFRTLKKQWKRRSSTTTFDLYFPGFPSDQPLRWYGRPRSLEDDYQHIAKGYIPVLLEFVALDPFAYGAEVVTVDAATPCVVVNGGDDRTRRFTIEVTGNGGVPVITSTTDGAKSLPFAQALGGGVVATLDFLEHELTIAGNDEYDYLSPGHQWFELLEGSNSITFTGCSQIEVTHREVYY